MTSSTRMMMACALLSLTLVGTSRAGFVVNMTESGGDVVATGSGTLDTQSFSSPGFTGTSSILGPQSGTAIFGTGQSDVFGQNAEVYSPISGPSSFGLGNSALASSATGDFVGVAIESNLLVPLGYVSGTLLNSTSTWAGQTFSSLGLTPGTYTWTWGSGSDADFFTMNIGASSVPEPSSLPLLGIGGVLLVAGVRYRRGANPPAE
jgi:hypothetical protein